MIMGVGVDIVDIARFERSIERTPSLPERLFTGSERTRPIQSLAGYFAAKEALIKALAGSGGMNWHEVVVVHSAEGAPSFELTGKALARMQTKGVSALHLSISHDAGVAIAVVIAEGGIAGLAPGTVEDVMSTVTAAVEKGGHE
jgi:holo-[acyl-carrier protein] synthase